MKITKGRFASLSVMALLLTSSLILSINIQPAMGESTIFIRPDGSIDPPTAPIQREGNIYTFTDDINDMIVVEKGNIIIDGAGYTLQGSGSGTGFGLYYLYWNSRVTIKNTNIKNFDIGVWISDSDFNTISGNNITNNVSAGIQLNYSDTNRITENDISSVGLSGDGIKMKRSDYNIIYGNNITDHFRGVVLDQANYNRFYHNKFKHNGLHVVRFSGSNMWDDGYPSGGNHWSGYEGSDLFRGFYQNITGSDWIGDTPYVVSVGQNDSFPLMVLHPPRRSLVVTRTWGGATYPPPGTHTYWEGTTVTVRAFYHMDYVFDYWELDGSKNYSNPIIVTMDSDHALHAVFTSWPWFPDGIAGGGRPPRLI